MGCKCRLTETIIAVVIILFTWWQVGTGVSQWIVTVAAALLILHSFSCGNCGICKTCMPEGKSKSKSKKRK